MRSVARAGGGAIPGRPYVRRGWAPRCCAACAAICVAIGASGCGSTSPSTYSHAGIEAAGRDLVSNLEGGRYRRACEDLTATARARVTVYPKGGCVGALALARGYLAAAGSPRLGMLVSKELARVTPRVVIENNGARYGSAIQARYEFGRWRFEAEDDAGAAVMARLRPSLEQVAQTMRSGAVQAAVARAEAGE
jgi:hypothetical protein